ncbi:hypothetical protein RDI58_013432 [Solanum bulbocastanum]|uniref:Reverse transcriptase zinc-binding domain-containing protein n=1 Tax=Solanum bulbocastanum TaxID=147425 RepID=A0AAN8TQP9_SOLBU
MTDHIMDNIKTTNSQSGNDVAWWMGNTQGRFTVKSAWNLTRNKHEIRKDYELIWKKELPFKFSLFMWRVWKRRIATDDNLKKMKINIVSRCWCCQNKKEETMTHLFLTAPIANKLWRHFVDCAGIKMEGMLQQQIIIAWWKHKASPQLQEVYRAIPAIVLWTIWRRRNAIKHGNNIRYEEMVNQIVGVVRQLIKHKYPWIKRIEWSWLDIISRLGNYKPKLHYLSVNWKPPDNRRIKCNTD